MRRVLLLVALAAGACRHAPAARPTAVATSTSTSRPPAYFEFQVDQPAHSVPGNPGPEYPAELRNNGTMGRVLVQFIVDTEGRPRMETFKVLESSHEEFSKAVRDVVPKMRFYPALKGGEKVPQVVQMPFTFRLPGAAG